MFGVNSVEMRRLVILEVHADHDAVEERDCRHGSVVEERAQFARAARVLELAQRLGLDLANALACHRELLTDLFQRVVGIHADAEAHA